MARPRPPPQTCPPPHDGKDAWIFAYGSLMWDPGFAYDEARPALLRGFHRAFCLWSRRYRGTAEFPGLVLGLDRGGACRGIVYRIAAARVDAVMAYLWDREMLNYSYRCRDLPVATAIGGVRARAFVVDRGHEQYAGKQPIGRAAAIVARAHGQRGTNRAYLENTVRHLDRMGIAEGPLHDLLARVRALAGE